jgi:hypothetical protein
MLLLKSLKMEGMFMLPHQGHLMTHARGNKPCMGVCVCMCVYVYTCERVYVYTCERVYINPDKSWAPSLL